MPLGVPAVDAAAVAATRDNSDGFTAVVALVAADEEAAAFALRFDDTGVEAPPAAVPACGRSSDKVK